MQVAELGERPHEDARPCSEITNPSERSSCTAWRTVIRATRNDQSTRLGGQTSASF
ncbi:hypothetical protein BZL29_8427 [Mycobacterium kansasii]|uniref:Uncharacterized protein n=1 Tax=Mycobacterium kansasii TaxID=1768 RepID=A0A1V3W9X9_MYCKA|nr:hypothetical protein BZL29_8427 [Mycobacterium kansasii]